MAKINGVDYDLHLENLDYENLSNKNTIYMNILRISKRKYGLPEINAQPSRKDKETLRKLANSDDFKKDISDIEAYIKMLEKKLEVLDPNLDIYSFYKEQNSVWRHHAPFMEFSREDNNTYLMHNLKHYLQDIVSKRKDIIKEFGQPKKPINYKGNRYSKDRVKRMEDYNNYLIAPEHYSDTERAFKGRVNRLIKTLSYPVTNEDYSNLTKPIKNAGVSSKIR